MSILVIVAQLWLFAGIDHSQMLYSKINDDKTPGPLTHVLVWDRDTGQIGRIYIEYGCYVSWWRNRNSWPSHGDIKTIVQTKPFEFAYVHEDGFIVIEQQPDSFWCQPLERK